MSNIFKYGVVDAFVNKLSFCSSELMLLNAFCWWYIFFMLNYFYNYSVIRLNLRWIFVQCRSWTCKEIYLLYLQS